MELVGSTHPPNLFATAIGDDANVIGGSSSGKTHVDWVRTELVILILVSVGIVTELDTLKVELLAIR